MAILKRRHALLLVLLLAYPIPMATADESTSPDRTRKEQQDDVRRKERTEDACDCCMKCLAATRENPGKKSRQGEGDGCADCCDRCGTTRLPMEETTPPEKK